MKILLELALMNFDLSLSPPDSFFPFLSNSNPSNDLGEGEKFTKSVELKEK